MANQSTPQLAAVEPRARSPQGEVLPIVDLISNLLNRRVSAVRIVGDGKSTAINHLRARFCDYPYIRLIDHGGPIEDLDKWDLTVFSSPTFVKGQVELKLARWTRDDCIEYLVAKAPNRCKSVMNRLIKSNDLWLASGSPRVIARTLDIMIKDDSVRSMQDAISTYFESIRFRRNRHRTKVTAKCLEHLVDDASFAMDLHRYVPGFLDSDTLKFLSIQTVRYVVASKSLIHALEKKQAPHCLCRLWTPKWIEYFSDALDRADSEAAIEHLDSLANLVWDRHSANAASVLYQLDPGWVPSRKKDLNFEHVQLPRINVPELFLESSLVTKANFSNANLPYCSLDNTNITGSDFGNANLSNSNLHLTIAKHVNFLSANLKEVDARKSNFAQANLAYANLERGNFWKANFCGANLQNANLNSTDLSNTKWSKDSNLADASLVGANLKNSNMVGVDFETVDLETVQLESCNLQQCNFEGCVITAGTLSRSQCQFALFSGSQFYECDLQRCYLINAKLGDIIWTNCNLRAADFTGCHFHYGSTRSGLVGSPYPSHGTRTGFYTDDYDDHHFKRIEDIRKASLQGCDLTDAKVFDADFYLVDLRDAIYDEKQKRHFQSCGAILFD